MFNYRFFFLSLLLMGSLPLFAQIHTNIDLPTGIKADGTAPDASAQLEVQSTEKGMLVPRMTTAQRQAIPSPATGLLVYDTNSQSFWYYNGTEWLNLTGSSGGGLWNLGPEGIYYNGGNVSIGTDDPSDYGLTRLLEVRGYDPDAGGTLKLTNATDENFLLFFSGRENDPESFLSWNGSRKMKLFTFDTPWDPVNKMVFDTNDYVGIHLNTPQEFLDVGGNINVAQDSSYKIGMKTVLHTRGLENVAVGAFALDKIQSGILNTAIGNHALNHNTTGSNNVAIGSIALYGNTIGNENVAIGNNALESNKGNSGSTAIGHLAMFYCDNTAIGTSTDNTALGYAALRGSWYGPPANTGTKNTAIGSWAMTENRTGFENVSVGTFALYNNDIGYENSALGAYAMYLNTEGAGNAVLGYKSLYNNTSGSNNTALGKGAPDR